MIHTFEITADLSPADAGELLFVIKDYLDEHNGELLAFFAEQKEETKEAV